MMKRMLPMLLLLSIGFASGCPRPDTPNANANSNSQPANRSASLNGNLNTNVNGGSDPTLGNILRSREDRTVTITVFADDAGRIQITVCPDTIKLSKGRGQRLRFHVFNNTDVNIKEVVIAFKTEDPMDGDFRITDIPAGGDKNTSVRRIKGAAAPKGYNYGIRVYDSTSTAPIAELDPEVVIAV